ncbi:MAG: hypothetical protein D6828_04250 [Nitrospirae bacterium]|nr:MAG: hypothetical protein D6828_04250 [Nitrospirota bacterium]
MEPFISTYLTGAASTLTANVFQALSSRLRNSIKGTDKEQALKRCLKVSIAAVLAAASDVNKEELHLIADIFESFFKEPDVGKEVAMLVRGMPLDKEELLDLFKHAGYDPDTLPGIDFDKAITTFEAAFLTASKEEPDLQGIIQVNQILKQTKIQIEILESMRELVAFLRQNLSNLSFIHKGQITAKEIDTNQPVTYQFPSVKLPPQKTDWEGHYLRTLISQCDPLDLTPIDETYMQETKGEAGIVKISDVFTTLYLEGLKRRKNQDIASLIRKKGSIADHGYRETEDKLIPIQAVEAVAAMPRIVILGKPGGGKSTLVNYMTVLLAKKRLGELLEEEKERLPKNYSDKNPLPVRIILRRFAAWLPTSNCRGMAGLVWDYLEKQMKDMGCKEQFKPLKHEITEKEGIVFFDGLDEVHESDEELKRTLIKEAIADFAAPLKKCQIVITCREYAYKEKDTWRLPESEFPMVELALFESEQIKYFTKIWYQIVGPQKGWDNEKCRHEASSLYQAIEDRPHLKILARYPLLLTLMSQVHGRDGTLPKDRADLYERAVNLLLAHWENRIIRDVDGRRRVEPGLVLRLGVRTRTLREALERVAFLAHERKKRKKAGSEDSADISKEELREELAKELESLDKAEKVIDYIQERAGLLQARDNRIYTFPHRTFQEYLTATYCLKQSNFDTLLSDRVRRNLSWWREVYLLAAGASRDTPRNISNLVDCLVIDEPDESLIHPDKAEQVLLGAQALIETGFVDRVRKEEDTGKPGPYSRTYRLIQQWLQKLIIADTDLSPRLRADSGNILAQLGDPRSEVMTVKDMQFCYVPAGPFWMGDPPSLNKTLNYDYWMARYPVTNAQFMEFVKAGGYKEGRYWQEAIKEGYRKEGEVKGKWDSDFREGPYDWGIPYTLSNHPVVGISCYEAFAFVLWLNERWHKEKILSEDLSIGLPKEAEWEKAARGGIKIPLNAIIVKIEEVMSESKPGLQENPNHRRKYPWGDKYDANRANSKETGINTTSTVGCFPKGVSPYGCEEMSGNVWQWCEDWYDEEQSGRVVRGGSFYDDPDNLRCAFRSGDEPDYLGVGRGFRVVVRPQFKNLFYT